MEKEPLKASQHLKPEEERMSQCERQHLRSNSVTIPSQTRPPSESTRWTQAHNKAFEEALAMFPDNHPNLWDEIVKHVPGAWSPADMKMRYEMLKGDCFLIESGITELPTYSDNVKVPAVAAEVHPAMPPVLSPLLASKKGAAWTEEEHKLFLLGLEQYGRGDWKSIARNFVISRTPGQVASHAQKYFLRQNASKKARKRSSIHDITIGDESNQNLHHNHNLVLTPDVAMQQLQEYQLQELQQAQQMLYSNPPNNLPNGFGNFNSNCF